MAEYIDREEVFEKYEEVQRRNGPWSFRELINSIPAADVAPMAHAKWVRNYRYNCMRIGRCSNCGKFLYVDNFCANCGAKMEVNDD